MTRQPSWKLLANLGDVQPIEYGGYFVYEDTTNVYGHEAERLEVYDNSGEWRIYRFSIDKCTFIDGILSDNKYHPEHPAWFAKPESEKANRPQDSTYLSNVASFVGDTVENMIAMLCSEDPVARATVYRNIGEYHGFENFDSYPLTFTKRSEVKKRYA